MNIEIDISDEVMDTINSEFDDCTVCGALIRNSEMRSHRNLHDDTQDEIRRLSLRVEELERDLFELVNIVEPPT